MKIRNLRSDIYFAGDDAHAFLPWIMGIMSCMATLLLCLGLTVGGWVMERSNSYANSFTVNIPATVENLPDKINAVVTMLQKLEGVVNVTQVSEEELQNLLKPWIGNREAVEALPLPVVFDVMTNGTTMVDYRRVQAALAAIAPGAEVDAHELWVANFIHFSSALRSLMALLAIVIISGLALMIAFTSRASLKLHARTVNLLHSIGAEDRYIMRQFQHEAFRVTLHGTVPGCLLAGLAYWLGGHYMTTFESSVIPPFAMRSPHVVLLVLMPLACSVVAFIAARISVIKQLERVL